MINITGKVSYIGVNDRKKNLFENNWPLPYGVSYNSYVIADEKTAVIDTLEYGSDSDYLKKIDTAIGGRRLDYLIVNHMEPDHSSMIGGLLKVYPEMLVVGNSKTFQMLQSYYNLSPCRFHEVKDGDQLDLGYHKLQFTLTPWVHWPETMMTYDTTDRILFSCDAFGSFGTLDGGIFDNEIVFDERWESEMRRYYSNIVGKWSNMVQKALMKLAGVPVNFVCPSHGPIWKENPAKVIGLYDKWSRHEAEEGCVIAYASMYGNTEKIADKIARKLSEQGIKNIRIFDVSKTHSSFILNEIWKYKGLILGSCAYNGDMHPMMSLLTHEISVSAPANKVFGVFGGSTWNGAGSKALVAFAEKAKLQVVAAPIEICGSYAEEKLTGLDEFITEFAAKIK